MPSYIFRFGNRFLTGKYETVTPSDPNAPVSFYRDAFGFHKFLVVLTSTGKAFGIDTTRGTIVWNRILGSSDANGPSISNPRLFALRSVWDDTAHPELLVIARDRHKDVRPSHVAIFPLCSSRLSQVTITIRLDVLSGGLIQPSRTLQPFAPGSPADIFFLRGHNKTILWVDEDLNVS